MGKATLAYRFARFLFAQNQASGLFAAAPTSLAVAPDHPAFRRVASGGHADLLVVERAYDQKRRRMRSEIVVEDARKIPVTSTLICIKEASYLSPGLNSSTKES